MMPSPSKPLLVVLGAAGALAVAAGAYAAIGALDDANDPVEAVGSLAVGSVTSTPGPSGSGSQQVLPLEELAGRFERGGDDADEFVVGNVELDLGPESWVLGSAAVADFDGDGSVEGIRDELAGLEGTTVTLLVRFDDDRDEADVYVIDDLDYRDTSGGPAPWERSVEGAATEDEIRTAAAAAVGDGARVTDLERDDGTAGWDAEVVDATGREHQVVLSAQGDVLDVRRDD